MRAPETIDTNSTSMNSAAVLRSLAAMARLLAALALARAASAQLPDSGSVDWEIEAVPLGSFHPQQLGALRFVAPDVGLVIGMYYNGVASRIFSSRDHYAAELTAAREPNVASIAISPRVPTADPWALNYIALYDETAHVNGPPGIIFTLPDGEQGSATIEGAPEEFSRVGQCHAWRACPSASDGCFACAVEAGRPGSADHRVSVLTSIDSGRRWAGVRHVCPEPDPDCAAVERFSHSVFPNATTWFISGIQPVSGPEHNWEIFVDRTVDAGQSWARVLAVPYFSEFFELGALDCFDGRVCSFVFTEGELYFPSDAPRTTYMFLTTDGFNTHERHVLVESPINPRNNRTIVRSVRFLPSSAVSPTRWQFWVGGWNSIQGGLTFRVTMNGTFSAHFCIIGTQNSESPIGIPYGSEF